VVTDDNVGWVLDAVRVCYFPPTLLVTFGTGRARYLHQPRAAGTDVRPSSCRHRFNRPDHFWPSMEPWYFHFLYFFHRTAIHSFSPLDEQASSFDGLVSTSNHLVPEEEEVCIKTSKPIWWTAELKLSGLKVTG